MTHFLKVGCCCTALLGGGFGLASAQEIPVATAPALAGALAQAKPGTTLVLAAGT